jgi:hypothetical protein
MPPSTDVSGGVDGSDRSSVRPRKDYSWESDHLTSIHYQILKPAHSSPYAQHNENEELMV